eukprot:g13947.t1
MCTRVLPILVVLVAVFVGWLRQKPIPEGTFFATIFPLMKGIRPATIFGSYSVPLTPEVPADMLPLPRPTNEKFYNLPEGYQMPASGLGMCCRPSAYDDETVYRTVLWYLLLGGRHIDGADLYLNHKAIGRGIKEAMKRGVKRSEIFLTTKIPTRFFGFDLSQKSVSRYLKELDLEYIDLLLLHFPASPPMLSRGECGEKELTDKECRQETWKGLSKARSQGMVRNLGVSNFGREQMKQIASLELAPIANNQFAYNPWAPDWQQAIFDYCIQNNIQVTAYSSLGSFLQKGKAFSTIETLKNIAKSHSKSVAQILLRWALQMDAAIIPGTGNPKHMKENLGVYGFSLSKDDMTKINLLRDDPVAKEFFYVDMGDQDAY